MQEGGVGAVELDQHPGEGGVQGLAAAGRGVPGPGGDGAGGGDLDEVADLLGGDGVVLDGRDEHLAVGGPHAEDDPLAQPGEEGTLDGPEGPGEGELDDEGGAEDCGLGLHPRGRISGAGLRGVRRPAAHQVRR